MDVIGGLPLSNVFTLANMLTLLRLILCGPIFYLLWSGGDRWLTFALFVIAAGTDLLDGYAARSRGEISSLGKVLDPVADKLLVVGTLLALALSGVIPMWWLITLTLKELALLLGGLILLGKAHRVVASRMLGKVSTVVLLAGIIGVLIGWDSLGRALVGTGILLSLGAGVDYLLLLLRKEQG